MQHQPFLINFSYLDQKEWSLLTNNKNCNHQVFGIVNNYTGDQFIYDRVFISSWQMAELLRARANYSILNTPQIMLANNQLDQHNLEMFVQTASFGLEKLLNKSTHENIVLETLTTIIRVVQALVKKYGYFRILPNMIKVTK